MKKIVLGFLACIAMVYSTVSLTAAEGKKYSTEVEIIPDVVYGHKFGLAMTMDVLKPRKDANGAGIICIVSGGWISGCFPPESALSSSGPYASIFDLRPLFDKGFTVFIVRHGSGEKFLLPEIMDDVRRSIRFIRCNASKFEVDPERLGAFGASAGGHLALMLATTSDEGVPNPARFEWMDRCYPDRVATAVAYYPTTDIRSWFDDGHWKDFGAFKFDPKLAERYSPLLFVTPKSAPALMIHGDKDAGVPIEHSEKMLAEYKKNNVPAELVVIKGVGHGFDLGWGGYADYSPAQMKDFIQARDASVAWFEKMLAPKTQAPAAPAAVPVKITAAPKNRLTLDYAVIDLAAGPSGPWPVSELAAAPADLLTNDAWRTTRILLRKIPAGTFKMGSPPDEAGRTPYMSDYSHTEETPHSVTLSKPFYTGVFPVTQKQWSRVMGNDPSWFSGNPKRPVENVSWNEIRGGICPNGVPDAAAFMGRLCAGSSQPLDLPTEAQWEYACRAGTIRAFNDPAKNNGEGANCTDEDLAPLGWYEGNSRLSTHDVGGKQANAWGLYDMHGNVSQWCLDWFAPYSGDVTDPAGPETAKRSGGRILRGGYFSFYAPGCRSAARSYDSSGPAEQGATRFNVCGFRLVLNCP